MSDERNHIYTGSGALRYLSISELATETGVDEGTLQLMDDKGFLSSIVDEGVYLYPSTILSSFNDQYDDFNAYMERFDLETGREKYREDGNDSSRDNEFILDNDEDDYTQVEEVFDADDEDFDELDSFEPHDDKSEKRRRRREKELKAEREHHRAELASAAEESRRAAQRRGEERRMEAERQARQRVDETRSRENSSKEQSHENIASTTRASHEPDVRQDIHDYELDRQARSMEEQARIQRAREMSQQKKEETEAYRSIGTSGIDYSKTGERKHEAWMDEKVETSGSDGSSHTSYVEPTRHKADRDAVREHAESSDSYRRADSAYREEAVPEADTYIATGTRSKAESAFREHPIEKMYEPAADIRTETTRDASSYHTERPSQHSHIDTGTHTDTHSQPRYGEDKSYSRTYESHNEGYVPRGTPATSPITNVYEPDRKYGEENRHQESYRTPRSEETQRYESTVIHDASGATERGGSVQKEPSRTDRGSGAERREFSRVQDNSLAESHSSYKEREQSVRIDAGSAKYEDRHYEKPASSVRESKGPNLVQTEGSAREGHGPTYQLDSNALAMHDSHHEREQGVSSDVDKTRTDRSTRAGESPTESFSDRGISSAERKVEKENNSGTESWRTYQHGHDSYTPARIDAYQKQEISQDHGADRTRPDGETSGTNRTRSEKTPDKTGTAFAAVAGTAAAFGTSVAKPIGNANNDEQAPKLSPRGKPVAGVSDRAEQHATPNSATEPGGVLPHETPRKIGSARSASASAGMQSPVQEGGGFHSNRIKIEQRANARPETVINVKENGFTVTFATDSAATTKARNAFSERGDVKRGTKDGAIPRSFNRKDRTSHGTHPHQGPYGTTWEPFGDRNNNAERNRGSSVNDRNKNSGAPYWGSAVNARQQIRNSAIISKNVAKLEKQLGTHYGLASLGRSIGMAILREAQLRETDAGSAAHEISAYTGWVLGSMAAAGAKYRVVESGSQIGIQLLNHNVTMQGALGSLNKAGLLGNTTIDFNADGVAGKLGAALTKFGQQNGIGDLSAMSAVDIKQAMKNANLTRDQKNVMELAFAMKNIGEYSQTAITNMMRQAGINTRGFKVNLNSQPSVNHALRLINQHCMDNGLQFFATMKLKDLKALLSAGKLKGNDVLLAQLVLALKQQGNLLSIMQRQGGKAGFQRLRFIQKIFGGADAFAAAMTVYRTITGVTQALRIAKLLAKNVGRVAAFAARATGIPKVLKARPREKAQTPPKPKKLPQASQPKTGLRSKVSAAKQKRILKKENKLAAKARKKALRLAKLKSHKILKPFVAMAEAYSKVSAAISKASIATLKYVGIAFGALYAIFLVVMGITFLVSSISSVGGFMVTDDGVSDSTGIADSMSGKVMAQLLELDQNWFDSIDGLSEQSPSSVAGHTVYGYFDPGSNSKHVIAKWGCNIVDEEGVPVDNGFQKHFMNGDGIEVGPYSNAKAILSCAHVYMEADYIDSAKYSAYCYGNPPGNSGLWKWSHWYNTEISPVYACPDGCAEHAYHCNERTLYDMIDDPNKNVVISSGLVEYAEHGCHQCPDTPLSYCNGCIPLVHDGKTIYVCPGHHEGCDNETYVNDGSNSISVPVTGTSVTVYDCTFTTHSGSQVASGTCGNRKRVYCQNASYCTNVGPTGKCAGHWICGGHLTDKVNNVSQPCTNPKATGTKTTVYCNGCMRMEDGTLRCIGHKINKTTCGGHSTESSSIVTLTYGRYVCQGHCDGHVAHVCLGHVDLNVEAFIVGLDEARIRLFEVDEENGAPPVAEGEGLWDINGIDWAIEVYNTDWYELYGISFMEVQGTPLSTQEIADLIADMPETTEERRTLMRWALESVGKISYYFGGTASCPGYEGNNFGTVVPPDAKGRCIKGLDCSHWVDWVYWSTLGNNLGNTYTGGLKSIGWGISKNELQPGDILVNHKTLPQGGHSGHAALFLCWVDEPGGKMIYVHETPENVTVTVANKDWDYYRRVITPDGTVAP